MKSKVDLQNHWTTKSRVLEAEDLFSHTYKKLGRGGVAGLVNCKDRRYEACYESKKDERFELRGGAAMYSLMHDTMIIKGEEVKSTDGDVIVMATNAFVHQTNGKDLEYTLKEAQDQEGVVILSTPASFNSNIREVMIRNPDLWQFVDAVEVYNSNLGDKANRKSNALYQRGLRYNPNLGLLASSDGHSYGEIGTSYTVFDLPNFEDIKTSEQLRQELRKGMRQAANNRENIKTKRNYVGPLVHAVIISSMIGLDKLTPKGMRKAPIIKQILDNGDKLALF
jgi:hypothetical protein